MREFIQKILNVVFPVKCVCCRAASGGAEGIVCPGCRALIAAEIPAGGFGEAAAAHADGAVFAYHYRGDAVKRAIYALKRANLYYINEFFAKSMYNSLRLCDKIKLDEIYAVTCVPRMIGSARAYGYNQTESLAKLIAKYAGKPYLRLLKASKLHDTEQKTLGGADRRENASNKYIPVNTAGIKDRAILLADDVLTTGATVSECARVLKNAGAAAVYAVCAAGTKHNGEKR